VSKILVVDDDLTVLILIQDMLEIAGHEVQTAENAKYALRALADGKLIDLMISDVVMPDVDGIALATMVAERFPDLPILLISGSWSVLQCPPKKWAFLSKPFRSSELLQAVECALPLPVTDPVGSATHRPSTHKRPA